MLSKCAQQKPATSFKHRFSVYVHWPFCLSKCPYCAFYSKVQKGVNQDNLVAEYLQELNFYRQFTFGQEVSSIFFGGGTPSLIEPQNIAKIIDYIAKNWPVADNIEISLEANPNSNKKDLFKNLKAAGINRLSLGVQSLNDEELKFLGRTHNAQEALRSMDEVLQNFDNHNIDLIYALPCQTTESWQQTLQKVLPLGFKHLSLYQLGIEENTMFYKKDVKPLPDEQAAKMYNQTTKILANQGYERYEISNFAQKGYRCRHNMNYWQGGNYLGIGNGAIGRIGTLATEFPCQTENLSARERAEELLIMGLRIKEGVDKESFFKQCHLPLEQLINQNKVQELQECGLLKNNKKSLRATAKGFLLLDKIVSELI